MKTLMKKRASRIAAYLKEQDISFEVAFIMSNDSNRTAFKIFDVLSSYILANFPYKMPYWQIRPCDSESYYLIIFEKF